MDSLDFANVCWESGGIVGNATIFGSVNRSPQLCPSPIDVVPPGDKNKSKKTKGSDEDESTSEKSLATDSSLV